MSQQAILVSFTLSERECKIQTTKAMFTLSVNGQIFVSFTFDFYQLYEKRYADAKYEQGLRTRHFAPSLPPISFNSFLPPANEVAGR